MNRHALTADAVFSADGVVGDAVIVEEGRVAAVTSRGATGDLETTHHPGATIFPSFIDSHFHPLGYAALMSGVSLKEAAGIDDLIDILAESTHRNPARAVVAQRFDDVALGRIPVRADLDRASPERPAIIYRYCGHVAVANTMALDAAGIDRDTVDPAGGSIDRDASGLPTGVLRETAIELVGGAIDHLVDPPEDRAVVASLEGLVALGVTRMTAIVSAGEAVWCGAGAELDTLCRVATDLPLDIDVLVTADTPAELRTAADRVRAAGGRLRFWGWKDFADGSFGGHTAAMWEPYADHQTTGTLRLRPDHALEMARTALELGGVAAVHAIGDRAIDEVLDVYDRILDQGADSNSLRIEHVSVPTARAVARLAATGIVASIQPSFVSTEAGWVEQRLGPSRHPYPFATMAAAGVRMVGGSDCPVERPDPLAGVTAAVTRPGWSDGQGLSLESAVSLFTRNAAEHLGLPAPLAPGTPAHLTVVGGKVASGTAAVDGVYVGGVATLLVPGRWPG